MRKETTEKMSGDLAVFLCVLCVRDLFSVHSVLYLFERSLFYRYRIDG